MAEGGDNKIECGFCLRQDEALDRPIQLPCKHVHCLGCLSGFYDENHIVQCALPACGMVFDVQLKELPAYDVQTEYKSCDVCTSNKIYNQQAVIYCIPCNRIFCTKHLQMHTEFFKEHQTLDMDKYLLQQNKQQPKNCTLHDNQPISAGCRKCLKLICVRCLSAVDSCTDEKSHQLMSLDELVVILNSQLDELKAKMVEKEEKLEQLFKFTSKAISEFEDETKDMVEMIHETRDKQIETLRLKYDNLEKELREVRQIVKSQLALYMEEQVRDKWSSLRNFRRRIEARMSHGHQCDIVSGFKDTGEKLQTLVEDALPSIKVKEVNRLKRKGGTSDIQLEVVSSHGFLIDDQPKLLPYIHLPKSVTLVQTVQLPSYPWSVRRWNNQTFVGMENYNVAKIDSSYQVNSFFLTYSNYPAALEVYGDRLYTLVQGSPWQIYVYDRSHQQVTSWHHTDSTSNFSGLAIVSEQVVAPNRANSSLHVYSLSGSLIKSISCPQLSRNWVSLCALGADSVIVSDYGLSQVFRVSISTGEVLWNCERIVKPEAVVSLGERFVLVAAESSSKLRILDGSTGEIASELSDIAIRAQGNHVSDMHIFGDTLLVASYSTKSVQYYQLIA